jgi:hypothetical protein
MTHNVIARSNDANRSGDFYSVQLASGEVKKWTLDQLDAAYRASFIDEETFVLPKGATTWSTLAEVVAAEPEPPSIPPPPVVADIDVDVDLGDDDLEAAGLRPRRRRGLVAALVFTAVAAGVTFAAVRNPALVQAARTRATAMIAKPAPFEVSVVRPVAAAPPVAAPVVTVEAPLAAAAAPAAPIVTPAAAPVTVARTTSGVAIVTATTEKTKAAADKPESAKKKAPPARRKSKSTTPFAKTANAHDPLNGNL